MARPNRYLASTGKSHELPFTSIAEREKLPLAESTEFTIPTYPIR
jgi:hypothetical protein